MFELLRVSAARHAPPALALLLALSADHAAYEHSRRPHYDEAALATAAAQKLSVKDRKDTAAATTIAGVDGGTKDQEEASLREVLAALPPEVRAALTERRFEPMGAQEQPAALAAALRNAHALANPVPKNNAAGAAATGAVIGGSAAGAGERGGRAGKVASTSTLAGACAACGASGASLYCSQCRTTAYCCKDCQKVSLSRPKGKQ